MFRTLQTWLWAQATAWLTAERPGGDVPLVDFERLSYELRPCDVILVEGRTRLSEVVKTITQSVWTHAALYIGRIHDTDSPALRARLTAFNQGDPGAQLLVESLMGRGTVITPLSHYKDHHLRLCRPTNISRQDAQHVVASAIKRLGHDYDVRQLLDLARFMFPYGLLPRRWRSSLFEHNAGVNTRSTCATMLVEAFQSVAYPIRPVMQRVAGGKLRVYVRNPRLYTPKEFDDSPYFDIIKHPFLGENDTSRYRHLPWSEDAVVGGYKNGE
ncbi:MAG: YiiX/YebB-like N1pC/P60 family cysteine hydrolase [Gammaproteobacteria bacterium]